MDPISKINIKKDTTFALMLEAQNRGWEVYYLEQHQLFLHSKNVHGLCTQIQVTDNVKDYFHAVKEIASIDLSEFNYIFMRKDPPFDMDYLYSTYLLELAQRQGCVIVNNPRSIRDANEKLFTSWFPECCTKTLVSSQKSLLKNFIQQYKIVIVKPLDQMGGKGVFLLQDNDLNINATLELLTENETTQIIAQQYIPEIKHGDKRILLINGKPYPYGLKRMLAKGDTRANLAVGGTAEGFELTHKDYKICEIIGPTLKEKGLFFVGIDVIGDYLTEINVTSPTCVREIESIYNVNICAEILNGLREF